MLRQLKHEPENEARQYIHLKNVIIRNAWIFTPARALVWRSKLSSVDGFSIGITEFQIPEIPSIGGLDISGVINQFAYASNPVNRTD
ncbi:MAG: hypothetical protein L0H55_15835 [Candidatus Nitrosocosmicus sp.]|nr:hypothetical protein [Candidatus Nitrosocosmicus sp.]